MLLRRLRASSNRRTSWPLGCAHLTSAQAIALLCPAPLSATRDSTPFQFFRCCSRSPFRLRSPPCRFPRLSRRRQVGAFRATSATLVKPQVRPAAQPRGATSFPRCRRTECGSAAGRIDRTLLTPRFDTYKLSEYQILVLEVPPAHPASRASRAPFRARASRVCELCWRARLMYAAPNGSEPCSGC